LVVKAQHRARDYKLIDDPVEHVFFRCGQDRVGVKLEDELAKPLVLRAQDIAHAVACEQEIVRHCSP
jgi:hypothetical protein